MMFLFPRARCPRFTGTDATLTINGGGNIKLSAPTEDKDPYKGVLFIQRWLNRHEDDVAGEQS